ncbi:hypothetical protein TevJSym_az00450 [endosymbiont of Tevnia jerichonana (vent Tica)]|uniref:Uncharacterized protein n=1 Tax=endosymbiont of Tevnia jerichonana (vent Tica) TaxID=1049564 RepID=G2FI55_9GAMM|nr:hypothetical protein TevJSym_az00450 [endosymbiont of Tevnia jerichonana (vent Tica)]
MIFMVVVARRPNRATLPFEPYRRILQATEQGEALILLQGAQIDSWFDQRTHRPDRIQRPVETGETRVAIPHQRAHPTAVALYQHHRPLQLSGLGHATLLQPLQLSAQRLFRLPLQLRVEGREDAQPLGVEVGLLIVAPQLAPHQVEKGGIAGGTLAALFDAERHLGHPLCSRLLDQLLLGHQLQHQIAPLQGTFGMAQRIVGGGPLHQRHQQGILRQRQLIQRAVEVELAGQAKTVDRPATLLTEVDLIGIGFEDLILAVVILQQQRHQRLVELAGEAALLAEEEVLHQLLSQGATALYHPAGAQVAPEGAGDADRIDTEVGVEVTVLHRDQCRHQLLRQLSPLHQDAVFAVGRMQAAD